jgi:hypothetical protein
MRRPFISLLAVFLSTLAFSAKAQQTCALNPDPAGLKGARPVEINPDVPPGTCGFLQFSWQDFFATNWPALPVDPTNTTAVARGLPDPARVIGQAKNDAPAVWEQYQSNWYQFWPSNPPPKAAAGQSFAAWNQNAWLPAACGPLRSKLDPNEPPPRILSSLSKFDAMPGVVQAASSLPLIDQNGYYVRYEIMMDYPAFNYINSNQFYLLSAQQAFEEKGQPFSFPVQSGSTPGATFIKAAWKTLSAAEINSGRFHIAKAFLYTPAATNVEETCAGPVTVGLVGLHIVQKTKLFPKWLWATFEQVDATPADPKNPGPVPPEGWGFFNPGSDKPLNKPKCPDGTTRPALCDFQPTSSHMGTSPDDHTGGPTQAVRANPIDRSKNQPALDQINSAAQSALRQINPSTEWQYYRLVEAQWEDPTSTPPFFPPNKVANMTMETYTQPASCMGCHNDAEAAVPVPSDLTFELGLAWQTRILPAGRIPAH